MKKLLLFTALLVAVDSIFATRISNDQIGRSTSRGRPAQTGQNFRSSTGSFVRRGSVVANQPAGSSFDPVYSVDPKNAPTKFFRKKPEDSSNLGNASKPLSEKELQDLLNRRAVAQKNYDKLSQELEFEEISENRAPLREAKSELDNLNSQIDNEQRYRKAVLLNENHGRGVVSLNEIHSDSEDDYSGYLDGKRGAVGY